MKKLLIMLGAITLTTTASTSVIACDKNGEKEKPISPVTAIKLNEQVAKDLGLIDIKGNNSVEIKINWNFWFDNLKWEVISNDMGRIRASNLLKDDDTAVSSESEDFLIHTLQLNKKDENNKFDRTEADLIKVSISDINPTVSKTADGSDYEVTGGTFKLQFEKGTENLGDKYTIDLKGNKLNIKSLLERFWLAEYKFNIIKDFVVGADNKKPNDEYDLYKDLKKENFVYKKLESLNTLLIDTGDKVSIIVTGRDTTGENWIKGDILKIKIKFGTIIGNDVYELHPFSN